MTSVFDQRDLNEHEFNQEMAVRTGRLPQTVDMREANARKAYEERTIDVSYDLINTLKIKQTYFHNVDWLQAIKHSICEKTQNLNLQFCLFQIKP